MAQQPDPQEVLDSLVYELKSFAVDAGYTLHQIEDKVLEGVCEAALRSWVSGFITRDLADLLVFEWIKQNGRKIW